MRVRFVACSLALALSACASAGTPRTGGHDPDVITADQAESTHEADAYDVIQTLRPNMLVTRGHDTFGSDPGIVVFLNGQQYGLVDDLRKIPAGSIEEIRYLSSSEAALRHGTGFSDGVIEVKTK